MSLDTWLKKKDKLSAFECKVCHQKFGNAGGLKSHQQWKHPSELYKQQYDKQSFLAFKPALNSAALLTLSTRPFMDKIAPPSASLTPPPPLSSFPPFDTLPLLPPPLLLGSIPSLSS